MNCLSFFRRLPVVILFLLVTAISLAQTSENENVTAFRRMKYGLFVHYAYGNAYTVTRKENGEVPASIDELADDFNAESFAEDAASFGVEYVIFTGWHCSMNVLYPSERMNIWRRDGIHASRRDVIRDLIKALKPKGIKLILYTHPSDGMDFSEKDQLTTGWNDSTGRYQIWNDFVNDLYGELASRYGTDVYGYFFDGGFPVQVDRQRLRRTVLSHNKNAILISNGLENECCEFDAKELNDAAYGLWFTEHSPHAVVTDVNTWWGYASMAAFLSTDSQGAWWSNGGKQRYSAADMFRYTVLQAATSNAGGVAWAASPYPGGGWETGVKETYKALKAVIEPVQKSIKNTRVSASFPVKAGTAIADLSWGGVALESPSGNEVYLHVLRKPTSKTIRLPTAADGRKFSSARLLKSKHKLNLVYDGSELLLELRGDDQWEDLDTVITLR